MDFVVKECDAIADKLPVDYSKLGDAEKRRLHLLAVDDKLAAEDLVAAVL